MPHRHLVACLTLALAGCLRAPAFNCQIDADCDLGGIAGRCEAGNVCSLYDAECAGSMHRYHASTPGLGGQCVDSTGADARPDATVDGAVDARPPEHACVQGLAHPATPGSCAEKVCARDATCCSTSWTGACVWWAETECGSACATMAFVGGFNADPANAAGKSGIVIDPVDLTILWSVDETERSTNAAGWADYDGDGDADLATAGGDLMRVFRNDGMRNGKLDLQELKTVSFNDLAPGKTLDGRDVDWVQLTPGGPLSVLFLGYGGMVRMDVDGTDHFAPPTLVVPADPSPLMWEVTIGDVNGDGYPELATAHWGGQPRFFQNDHGALVQTAWEGTSLSKDAIGIQWCNLDADLAPELIVTNLSNMTIYDVEAATNTVKPAPSRTFNEGNYRSVRCADLNGDGYLDLFVSFWNESLPQAFAGDGTLGGLQKQWTAGTKSPRTKGAWNTDLGDIDHDGKLDVYISGNGYNNPDPVHTLALIYYRNTSAPGGVISFTEQRVDGAAIPQDTSGIKLAPKPPIAP